MLNSMSRWVGKQVRLKLNAWRVVEGVLQGYDSYLNLLLVEAMEVKNEGNQRINIGTCFVRGNNISVIETLDSTKI
ncbi:hypothetical protein Pcinc_022244 [Petrolisthes cinctipes]|uniref:Sm protein G n=1 Tax=Petrolisthes cinctipes TaxID=88211 RepID=A0AAE1FFQ5_PETCI|nr:hypothetical protein Pcinc_022244 [Petrolisthes cinctipes]